MLSAYILNHQSITFFTFALSSNSCIWSRPTRNTIYKFYKLYFYYISYNCISTRPWFDTSKNIIQPLKLAPVFFQRKNQLANRVAVQLFGVRFWLELDDIRLIRLRPIRNNINKSNFLLTEARKRRYPPYMCSSEIAQRNLAGCLF